jgi:hypothetical protein
MEEDMENLLPGADDAVILERAIPEQTTEEPGDETTGSEPIMPPRNSLVSRLLARLLSRNPGRPAQLDSSIDSLDFDALESLADPSETPLSPRTRTSSTDSEPEKEMEGSWYVVDEDGV